MNSNLKYTFAIEILLFFYGARTATASDRVQWTGRLEEEQGTHTTEHRHNLVFVRMDGRKYDIVDSPELVKLHCESEKIYEISIGGEETPRFLFWGGGLKVSNFKVLREGATERIPHHMSMPNRSSNFERGRL